MPRRANAAFLTIPAIAAIAALTLSGCSGSGKPAEQEDGPLTKYMSALWDGEEFDQEQFDAEQQEIEELVAVCMQKEGFEYKPNVQTGGMVTFDDEDGPQWGTEEFAKEFGYGMSTDPWGNQTPDPNEGEEYVDPNEKYVSSLSESEQAAFYETLYGAGPTEEQLAEMDENGSYTSDWTQEGCNGSARHELQQDTTGSQAAYEDPEFTELFEAINQMYAPIWDETQRPDELAKLDTEWVDCMTGKGYSEYTSPMDANTKVNDELNEIYMGGQDPEGEYVEPSAADQAKMEAEVEKFKSHEIEIATADFACKKKVDYDAKTQKYQFALEQEFVDEHKPELDALLAKYATKSDSKKSEK